MIAVDDFHIDRARRGKQALPAMPRYPGDRRRYWMPAVVFFSSLTRERAIHYVIKRVIHHRIGQIDRGGHPIYWFLSMRYYANYFYRRRRKGENILNTQIYSLYFWCFLPLELLDTNINIYYKSTINIGFRGNAGCLCEIISFIFNLIKLIKVIKLYIARGFERFLKYTKVNYWNVGKRDEKKGKNVKARMTKPGYKCYENINVQRYFNSLRNV